MRRFVSSLAIFLTACATTSPRFDQELATTFAQDDMRKLETHELELYYPAEYADAAKHVAERATECIQLMRAKDVNQREYPKALIFLSSANYNNAYVGGLQGGEPLLSVNPLSVTSELFHYFGLGGANAGDVACHEMFHYVHYEQTHGFWRVVNTVFGPLLPPQAFLERWFTEGAAQYYEGRLLRNVGRPFSPMYRGAFDSFVAMRGGHVSPGDLAVNQRELNPFSGAYLTGLHFIEWLVAKYGEDKLWALMDLQGRSVFSPFGYTLRFKSIYGLSVGALVDEWEKELVASLVVRTRPATEQIVLDDVGQFARLAAHPSGVTAIVSSGNEQVPLLRILEADGRVRVEKRLAKLGTDRDYVFVGPGTMSGLSFTGDGRFLYLLNDDLIDRGDTRAQIWKLDAQTGEVLKVWQNVGRGMAGAVSADGATFTFADFPPGKSRIVERELELGTERVLVELPPGLSVGAPAWNPSHTRLVYSRLDANGWNLVLRDEDGTSIDLTTDGAFNYGARWADDTHLVFSRIAGKYLQAHRIDLANPGEVEQLTDAPYGVLDPSPAGERVLFAARDGVHWSIDRAPMTGPKSALSTEPKPEWHEPAPLKILSDEKYSALDHLFVPQLRVPGASYSFSTGASVSLSVMGRDRLGKHTWAINGSLGVPQWQDNYLQVGYRNLTLAPWAISASGSRSATISEAYWSGGIYASRTVFTVPIFFGVQTEVWQPFGQQTEKFIGPTASISYSAGDGTQYAGSQRSFSTSFDVSAYPRAFGSDRDVLDLRGTVAVALPLPFSKRHSFSLAATGRALPGAPAGALRVGGVSSYAGSLPFGGSREPFPSGPGVFLPGTMVEGVRGFDDVAVRAQHVAIFNARYRYAVIIDRGFASLLYLFPSIFFRQVDLELFGAGAITEALTLRSAGASLSFRTTLGGFIPVSLSYQFAWRFDLGLPPLHVVGFSLD
jgi:hypothetical protein